MKKYLILILIMLCSAQLCHAIESGSLALWQTGDSERNIVSGGIGIGIGIFYPQAVNDYIADHTSHLMLTTGIVEMIANFFGKASINVRPHQVIEISVFVEGGWAPKYLVVNVGDDYYFSFSRISPGISPKIHIPLGTGRHSFFFAPAVTFNFLKFKDGQLSKPEYKAKPVGGKFQAGFNLDFKKIQLQPFFGYDHAVGMGTGPNGEALELSYSGGQLGIELHF